MTNEHDDDVEPEVSEAAVETEIYPPLAEDVEESESIEGIRDSDSSLARSDEQIDADVDDEPADRI